MKKWSDEDVIDLMFEVSDGRSLFVSTAYAPIDWIESAAIALRTFGHQIHGGIYDLRAGEFGPEFANGASWRGSISPSPDGYSFRFTSNPITLTLRAVKSRVRLTCI